MLEKERFSLTLGADFSYNSSEVGVVLDVFVNRRSVGELMKKFYYEKWIPFTFNKRRILILAIASYIALC